MNLVIAVRRYPCKKSFREVMVDLYW